MWIKTSKAYKKKPIISKPIEEKKEEAPIVTPSYKVVKIAPIIEKEQEETNLFEEEEEE